MNNGKEYEEFVRRLQQAMITSDNFNRQKNIIVEKNKRIKDNIGIEREFDLYWEYELGGVVYKTVIECKDYDRKISVIKIDSFIGKLKDFPGFRGVFATKVGYQSGAEAKAISNNIDLLIVRYQNDSDWCDKEGNHYTKMIHIDSTIISPLRLQNFMPVFDKEWITQNGIEVPEVIKFNLKADKIIFEELDSGLKYSLHDFKQKLGNDAIDNEEICTYRRTPQNTFLIIEDLKLKLKSFEILYFPERKDNFPIDFDFSKELIGVIEYVNKNVKKSIFRGARIIVEDI